MGTANHPKMLKGYKVLVVGDEPLEALDYCDRLMAAGADIVGRFTTVTQALPASRGRDVALIDYA
jgi:hypothetical protein